jgi:carboxymethylenebutenolidase
MGGGRALRVGAQYHDRIKAVASFHGGNLASDKDDSPHHLADRFKARVYVGVAGGRPEFSAGAVSAPR